jgi:glycosyltransferase involved in cell wall biosynthesis
MTPARVAFVIGTTSGGTGGHVRMLVAGLTARGVQVAVYGPAAVERQFGFTAAGAAFHPVDIADRPRPARDLAAVRQLRRALSGAGAPAIVHAHGLRAGALAVFALGPIGRRDGVALTVTLHNAPPSGGLAGVIYTVLERVVASGADSVLCVSGDLEERIRRRGARSCSRAVVPAALPGRPAPGDATLTDPDAAPDPDPDAAPDPDPDAVPDPDRDAVWAEFGASHRPLVLAAGRLAPQKGFGTLLDAAARWRDRTPQPVLLIAGEGPLAAELAARIDAERLSARLIGHRGDLPALMAAADVLVQPSVWEGQPLFAQEALRSGTPLVATRVGGVPELTGEDAALLVPPSDPDTLAAAILRVLDDPGLARRIRTAARDRARSLPSEEDAIDAVITEYRRLAPGPDWPGGAG